MQKFFSGKDKKPPDSSHLLPESGEQWGQNPSDSQFPDQRPGQKGKGVAWPQVSLADAEARLEPGSRRCQHKQPIPQPRKPAAKGPQKAVNQSQDQPQKTAQPESPGSQTRGRHPNSRCRQPPALGSS